MTPFSCGQCGQTIFFENTHCQQCGSYQAYVPELAQMQAFADPQADEQYLPCANRERYGLCNWMVARANGHELCRSCRLTTQYPDTSLPAHLEAWQSIEQAKRRLYVALDSLGLPLQGKSSADDAWGISFSFRASQVGEKPVLTGHDEGVITLNIAEADDVHRESARVAFDEPMRTLLGHLRHEVSHYLQYRWLNNPPALERCRAVFGDERIDYVEALKKQHSEGPPADWQAHYISAYASAHPWEDWAETCAHVLLVLDAVDTAAAWGVRLESRMAQAQPTADAVNDAIGYQVLAHWLPLAQFLNAMNRSLGLRDSYPFLMPDAVLSKMNAVQALLGEAARQHRTQG